jgi:hypothetical protein
MRKHEFLAHLLLVLAFPATESSAYVAYLVLPPISADHRTLLRMSMSCSPP